MAGDDSVVLCYHAVSPTWPIGLSIRPESLEEQVSLLLRRGYKPATFWEIVHQPPARKSFSVTFDDGWVSTLEHGFPVLERLGVPATVFVASSLVDTHDQRLRGAVIDPWADGPHRDELYCLSWPELRRLQDAGWEIGAHSMTHPLLTQVDDETLERELVGSKARCEEMLGVPCRTMAYPTGNFDARVERATEAAGYDAAAALPKRFETGRPLAWPRVSVQRDDSAFVYRAKVSRAVRAMRQSQLWPRIDQVRLAISGGSRRAAVPE